MISKLEIVDINNTPVKYLPKVKFFQNHNLFEFKEGLNILIGSNAIGKTTLLRLLAIYMHCEQGGVSAITQTSIQNLIKNQIRRLDEEHETYTGCNVFHDGQPTFYLSSSETHGIQFGRFDDDFFEKGICSAYSKSSSTGQKAIRMINVLVEDLEKVKEIKILFDPNRVNDVWKNMYKLATSVILNPNIEKSKHTVLIDEIDVGLDIKNQQLSWNFIKKLSKKYQVIVAAHGFFSMSKEIRSEANYIEFEPNYLTNTLDILKAF